MGPMLLLIFVVLALVAFAGMFKTSNGAARKSLALLALALLAVGLAVSSVTYVPSDKVGIVKQAAVEVVIEAEGVPAE